VLIGVVITFVLLARTTKKSTVQSLSYTTFEHDITANQMKTATITSTGGVTGTHRVARVHIRDQASTRRDIRSFRCNCRQPTWCRRHHTQKHAWSVVDAKGPST
jgi:hypothetical protein